jgi:hypothetical protein
MKQIRQCVITWPAASNAALYYHPLVPSFPAHATTASSATALAPAAGTIRNLCVELVSAIGGTDAVTITLHKAGVASALAVTVTDPATTGADTSNSVTFAAGDSFVLVRTGSGLPAAGTAMVSFEWEPDDGLTSIYGFGGQQDVLASSGPYRDGLLDGGGDINGWNGSADQAKTLIGLAGDVTGFYVVLSAAPGTGDTRVFTVYKNGTAQDGSGGTVDTRLTIADLATSGNVAFTLPVVSGDYLHIHATHTGTPASARACGSVTFLSTTAGRWHVGAYTTNQYSASATNYLYPTGSSSAWDATETNRQHIAGTTPYLLGGMIGRLQVAPGGATSATFTLRREQADTVQTITFSGSSTAEATAGAVVEFASASEQLSVQSVPSGTPTVSNSFPKFAWYGANIPTPIEGSHVLGSDGTVTTTRTGLINLDGVTRAVAGPGVQFIGGSKGFIEQAAPPAGIANTALVFAEDNGAGKLRLMCQFPTGSAQQLAIEP